jgi:hypothetical protein
LPVREERVLDGIEGDLRGCEPRLVSMFAIFTRLTRDEGAPPAEPRRRGARRRRIWPDREPSVELGAIVVILLGLSVLLVVLAVIAGSSGHGCGPGPRLRVAVGTHVLGCQSAQELPNRGS